MSKAASLSFTASSVAPASVAIDRLTWLMRLRWLALGGVSASAALAVIGLVPGLNLIVISLAVLFGIASNIYIRWRINHRNHVNVESLHVGQALLDTIVLTLVLWAAGGVDCPFTSFYVFPVLLAVLLSGRHTFLPTAFASFAGLLWQILACHIPSLRMGRWNPPEPWDELLGFIASVLTIGMVAYFAARFIEAMREQMKAKQEADELLQLSFERLEAGVELIEGGIIMWQNPYAIQTFGDRRQAVWNCPGMKRRTDCPHHSQQCSIASEEGLRCRFPLSTETSERQAISRATWHNRDSIFEVMLLSPSTLSQRVAIYVDQTAEVTYQQKLMHTERLASLGRTAQGVAHELNTPLATIQTLGRDLLDVLESSWSTDNIEDLRESTQVILEEVQRCSRITHALLGRSDPSMSRLGGGVGALSAAVKRAVSLVFPHNPDQVVLKLDEVGHLCFPLDPLVQIFVNLIQNAWDATVELKNREGDLENLPYILVQGEYDSLGRLVLSVVDEGIGLNAESSVLFEPFFTTKSIGQGTGLGLYTSYALAKELGGEMNLTSRIPRGAVARLFLPLDDAS